MKQLRHQPFSHLFIRNQLHIQRVRRKRTAQQLLKLWQILFLYPIQFFTVHKFHSGFSQKPLHPFRLHAQRIDFFPVQIALALICSLQLCNFLRKITAAHLFFFQKSGHNREKVFKPDNSSGSPFQPICALIQCIRCKMSINLFFKQNAYRLLSISYSLRSAAESLPIFQIAHCTFQKLQTILQNSMGQQHVSIPVDPHIGVLLLLKNL